MVLVALFTLVYLAPWKRWWQGAGDTKGMHHPPKVEPLIILPSFCHTRLKQLGLKQLELQYKWRM